MSTTNSNTIATATDLSRPQAGLWTELRSLPRAAWVLFLGIFLNRFGTFVIPFLTLYLKRRGYTVGDTALAVGCYGAGTLFASFFGGYLADRIGRRKTITLSMFGGAVTMLLLSAADSIWTITFIALLNGAAGEIYRPASSALLADLVPSRHRIIAFSAYRMALNAGWAFGPATAGFITARSFTWLFIGDALTSILFGLVAWFALPHGVRSTTQESGWRPAIESMKRNPGFLQYLAGSFFVAFIFFQISSTYSLFVTALGYSVTTYGALISFNGFIVVCGELVVSNYTRRFDPRRVIALGYCLAGLGFGLNTFATTIPMLALGLFILTIGEMISIPVAVAYIADLAPANMRGRYLGAHGLMWGVALIVAPGIGMLLLAHGPAYLWSACALSGLIGATIMLWSKSVKPRRRN
jgi:MFS family permease